MGNRYAKPDTIDSNRLDQKHRWIYIHPSQNITIGTLSTEVKNTIKKYHFIKRNIPGYPIRNYLKKTVVLEQAPAAYEFTKQDFQMAEQVQKNEIVIGEWYLVESLNFHYNARMLTSIDVYTKEYIFNYFNNQNDNKSYPLTINESDLNDRIRHVPYPWVKKQNNNIVNMYKPIDRQIQLKALQLLNDNNFDFSEIINKIFNNLYKNWQSFEEDMSSKSNDKNLMTKLEQEYNFYLENNKSMNASDDINKSKCDDKVNVLDYCRKFADLLQVLKGNQIGSLVEIIEKIAPNALGGDFMNDSGIDIFPEQIELSKLKELIELGTKMNRENIQSAKQQAQEQEQELQYDHDTMVNSCNETEMDGINDDEFLNDPLIADIATAMVSIKENRNKSPLDLLFQAMDEMNDESHT